MRGIGINRYGPYLLGMESDVIKPHTVEGFPLAKGGTRTNPMLAHGSWISRASLYSSLILQVELLPKAYPLGALPCLS